MLQLLRVTLHAHPTVSAAILLLLAQLAGMRNICTMGHASVPRPVLGQGSGYPAPIQPGVCVPRALCAQQIRLLLLLAMALQIPSVGRVHARMVALVFRQEILLHVSVRKVIKVFCVKPGTFSARQASAKTMAPAPKSIMDIIALVFVGTQVLTAPYFKIVLQLFPLHISSISNRES